MDNVQKIRNVNKRINYIQKWREEDGSWRYQVIGKDGVVVAEMRFALGRLEQNRLTNSDLLEIVRDRLEALNRSSSGSFRSTACLQHVIEALFWADTPAFVADNKSDNTPDTRQGEPTKGDE